MHVDSVKIGGDIQFNCRLAEGGTDLEDVGFDGIVSVELEDYRYWRTWEAESEGLIRSHEFLSCFVR